MPLRFTDGVTLHTEGPLRTVCLRDGWYVLGQGMSIPCRDQADAESTLAALRQPKQPKPAK